MILKMFVFYKVYYIIFIAKYCLVFAIVIDTNFISHVTFSVHWSFFALLELEFFISTNIFKL
jgi:hypothetical protein